MPNEAQDPMPAKRHVAITGFCSSAIAPASPKGAYYWCANKLHDRQGWWKCNRDVGTSLAHETMHIRHTFDSC